MACNWHVITCHYMDYMPLHAIEDATVSPSLAAGGPGSAGPTATRIRSVITATATPGSDSGSGWQSGHH